LTDLFNVLLSVFIVFYVAWCGYSAFIFLNTAEDKVALIKKKTKAYYIFMHGKFVLYTVDAVFILGMVIIFVKYLMHNMGGF